MPDACVPVVRIAAGSATLCFFLDPVHALVFFGRGEPSDHASPVSATLSLTETNAVAAYPPSETLGDAHASWATIGLRPRVPPSPPVLRP